MPSTTLNGEAETQESSSARTRKSKVIYFCVAAAVGVLGYFGWKLGSRTGYESAEYRLLEADGSFEIREYPELTLVTTRMQSDSQAEDGSFMRLFGYISGGNADQQKIAMTTPVLMTSSEDSPHDQMGFVIPREIAVGEVPDPSGENVEISRRSGGQFAVYRFAGRMTEQSKANAEKKLRQWMEQTGRNGEAPAEYAGYDPPWTPGALRRNEILIRLQ